MIKIKLRLRNSGNKWPLMSDSILPRAQELAPHYSIQLKPKIPFSRDGV